ncbi:unnamed protein product [Cuscuta campestris]|uniref:Uncharacterized protein n=1 Tax=Cuscuta campestris TaxID=132261 RepID=A0A484L6V7_9ASTE|nr:unnamed protein product [Cuscuta campestris]
MNGMEVRLGVGQRWVVRDKSFFLFFQLASKRTQKLRILGLHGKREKFALKFCNEVCYFFKSCNEICKRII